MQLGAALTARAEEEQVTLSPDSYSRPSRAYGIIVESLSLLLESLGGEAEVREALAKLGLRPGFDLKAALEAARGLRRGDRQVDPYEVPELMEDGLRKELAAYYTGPRWAELMSSVAAQYLDEWGVSGAVAADPFMGTGALLLSLARSLGCGRVAKLIGVERDPLACLQGYSLLVSLCGADRVEVRCGDSFRLVGLGPSGLEGNSAHVVITNPPFTRWELLDRGYRRFLEGLLEASGYSRYVTRGQVNLQALALFLADGVLRYNGLLAAVLPASTFYTIYGEGVKRFLRENYYVMALAQGRGQAAFSVGSGFKEVILLASKSRRRGATAFITLGDGPVSYSGGAVRAPGASYVDLASAPPVLDFNWLSLFEVGRLRPLLELISRATSSGRLRPMGEVLGRGGMLRGVEMYGPDFFLIPNRRWRVAGEGEDSIIISDGVRELEIPRRYLVPALRRPALYADRLVVDADHYLLSVPEGEGLPEGVREYAEWGLSSGAASAAAKAFGASWLSHVYRQVKAKGPFATLFLPDKVDPAFRGRGVFAVATARPASATKNFYLVTDGECSPLLTLWFNSTPFILMLVHAGRKISEGWSRLLEDDYLRLPAPSREACRLLRSRAEEVIAGLAGQRLPPLREQVGGGQRLAIDGPVMEAVGARDGELEDLQELLGESLEGLAGTPKR
ncbi:N-6 DNA methylase [Acidilobus sp.]|uniref:N-6 DNA methylase n=1 Tax=Acidilobus sp. TaxID=1872109 RepID=UPI003D011B1A